MDETRPYSNSPQTGGIEYLSLRGKKRGMRTGYTTGACATAATRAALLTLLDGQVPASVTITLPIGEKVTFIVHRSECHADGSITASVIKDAGDDPDVTHGAELCSTVSWRETSGIEIDGGIGVGRVTKLQGTELRKGPRSRKVHKCGTVLSQYASDVPIIRAR